MIAIFNTLSEAQNYSNRVHSYLVANRPHYNAVKWGDPVQSADGLKWWVKVPKDMEGKVWSEPLPTTEISKAIDTTIPLPERGEVILNKYYLFKGDIVKCIQGHTRTEWEPKDTPALFTFFRDNTDQLQWIENERIEIGWERIYLAIRYKCIQPHTTVKGQTPDITPALWTKVTVGVLPWVQPGSTNPYMKGDKVTFNGFTWESLIDNNVWSPAVYGWKKV